MWFVALLLIAAAGFVWWQIEHDKHAAAQKSAQQRYDIKHVYAQRGLAIRQSDIDAIMDAPDIENAHQKLLETAIKYTLSLEKSGRSTAGISEYQTAEFRRLAAEQGGIATDEDIYLLLLTKITGDAFIRRSINRAQQESASNVFTEFAKTVQALRETHGGQVQSNPGSFQVGRQG